MRHALSNLSSNQTRQTVKFNDEVRKVIDKKSTRENVFYWQKQHLPVLEIVEMFYRLGRTVIA